MCDTFLSLWYISLSVLYLCSHSLSLSATSHLLTTFYWVYAWQFFPHTRTWTIFGPFNCNILRHCPYPGLGWSVTPHPCCSMPRGVKTKLTWSWWTVIPTTGWRPGTVLFPSCFLLRFEKLQRSSPGFEVWCWEICCHSDRLAFVSYLLFSLIVFSILSLCWIFGILTMWHGVYFWLWLLWFCMPLYLDNESFP